MVDAFDAGWYLGGYHRTWDINYTTGYFPQYGEFRDFFAFDLTSPAIEGVVVGATFNVFAANIVTGDEFETMQIVDVTTSVDEVVAGEPDRFDIFEDLGTGKVYAVRKILVGEAWTPISIELNADAVADINAALGGKFALGGVETTIDELGPQQNIFGGVGLVAGRRSPTCVEVGRRRLLSGHGRRQQDDRDRDFDPGPEIG